MTSLRCLLALSGLALALSPTVSAEETSESGSTLVGLPPSHSLASIQHPVFVDGPGETPEGPFSNFRLHLSYALEGNAAVVITHPKGSERIPLPPGASQTVDLAWEHLPNRPARLRLWRPGDLEPVVSTVPDSRVSAGGVVLSRTDTQESVDLSGDFTLMTQFQTTGNGTLAALAPAEGKWQPDGKSLFLRDGKLVYDIGWVGALRGSKRVNDGEPHTAVLVVQDGKATLFLDGKPEGRKEDFTAEDKPDHVFKIGSTATDFGGDFEGGEIQTVQFWKRALSRKEIGQLSSGADREVNTPDFHWRSETQGAAELTTFGALEGYPATLTLESEGALKVNSAWVQPLEKSDHRSLVEAWDNESLKRGSEIYRTLCVTCHGTPEQEGSIPLALKFHEGEFKNGGDPYRMWQSISRGYGLMMPQPQYTTRQVYDVMHYIRESLVRPSNEGQLFPTDEDYLASLPRGMSLVEEKESERRTPQYELMDFGDYLFWTYQIEPGPLEPGVNLAYKALAIRLDEGLGGVSKGNTWAIYDLDTMRLATVYSGDEFVDWKGIAFDGSHGTHTSIVGERLLTTPNAPGWANPETGAWKDPRLEGRDGRKFGPLPRDWVHFKGLDLSSNPVSIRYTVGDTEVIETPVLDGENVARYLQMGKNPHELELRLATDSTLTIPPRETPVTLVVDTRGEHPPLFLPDKLPPTKPVSQRFAGTTTTKIERGENEGAFAVDTLTAPDADANPWQSWMRLSGIDFFRDGKSAAVCTWMGDVWIVSGIDQEEGELTWQRICAGLFQPLGLKIVDEEIYVSCRDMIAKLHDHDGDGEIDEIESFNNDHQVTEHFHEFAMGLQSDEEGNFYYAKSARHAKTALVPHHGTLLRVSPDGRTTDILASGFRAANGVCLNPDGSFIVTDQEGHWNPKNRINWVRGKGPDEFFGNIFGYTPVTDESDEAMEKPLCWITNAFDRSPSELLWVPENANWGPLNGSLLNLSYGYGKIYVVPHAFAGDQVQGGMSPLPIERLPTGIMRGRFHPGNGQLYGCGMFAWGGTQKQAGGLYRIRYTGLPALLPVGLEAKAETVVLTFSDPIDPGTAEIPGNYEIRTWDLERSARYGSKHLNEKQLKVTQARLQDDGRTILLTVPDLAPTRGMEIRCQVRSPLGLNEIERVIHNTIHQLP